MKSCKKKLLPISNNQWFQHLCNVDDQAHKVAATVAFRVVARIRCHIQNDIRVKGVN